MQNQKIDWRHFEDIVADDNAVVARINILELRVPSYSVEVGSLANDGKFIRRHMKGEDLPNAVSVLERAMYKIAELEKDALAKEEERAAEARKKKSKYLENVEKRREENRQRGSKKR